MINHSGAAETVLFSLMLAVVLGPPIAALVSMRRVGRGWARVRLLSYSGTAILYALNSMLIFSSGNAAGGGTSAIIAWFAGKGAISAWQAWKTGDYRPAYMRAKPVAMAQDMTTASHAETSA